jgi:PAS domain S-box-containing protein
MSETNSPLSLVASGVPVAGEPVAVHDAARRGGSVTDEQRDASEGRLLWVTGFGLSAVADGAPAPAELETRALVVFLQLSGTEHGDRRHLEVLRDRAVVATDMAFTISDPRREDDPLIWVNPSFTRLTGYPIDEVVGRNCRLLQGPNTDRTVVRRIAESLQRREPITAVLLNYRRDGTAYWNQVSISPVFDGGGELVNFVGVQNDVTERVLVEQERAAALADAESARNQLRLLAEATTQMTEALDVVDACARLARIVVPQLADLCAVDLVDRPVSAPRPASPSPRGTPRTRAGCGSSGSCAGTGPAGAPTPAGCCRGPRPCCWPSCPRAGPSATPTTRPPPPSTTGCGCARRWSCRCGPAGACWAPSRCSPSTPTAAATPRATCTWPPTSPAGRGSPSTTPGCTRWSTPPPPRCSAACCRSSAT